VKGDGTRTLGELVEASPVICKSAAICRLRHGVQWRRVVPAGETVLLTHTRSARLGAVYKDAGALITPQMERRFDEISRDIDGFHFGRFDIRFESLEALREGEGFTILELNGAGAEVLHIWDGSKSLANAYRDLWKQYRTLFAVAAENRRLGHAPAGLWTMARQQIRQERLRKAYPPSS
jgi:hypothetical protein